MQRPAEDESVEAAEDYRPLMVRFQDMDTGAVTEMQPVSEELAALLGRAAMISMAQGRASIDPFPGQEQAHLSFSSVMGAIGTSFDPVSAWVGQTAMQSGANMTRILSATHLLTEELKHFESVVSPTEILKTPLTWTISIREAMKKAQEFFIKTPAPKPKTLDVRHLIAAFLWLPQFHERDFHEMQLNRSQLREPFVEFVHSLYPEEADYWWEQLIDAGHPEHTPAATPTDYSSPTPAALLRWLDNDTQRSLYSSRYDADGREDEDLLDIDRDVDALSALIASRTMAPPLSIGVFGEWGSGKSFFMHHLRRRVEEFADRAVNSQRPQREVAFYKNIIQIEFNAWHYSEGNLWASLVEHIFRNLRKTRGETEEEVGKRRNALLKRLARREASLLRKEEMVLKSEAQVARAGTKVEELEQQKRLKQAELEELQEKKHNALRTLPSTLQLDSELREKTISLLKELGFNSLGRTAFELKEALSDARAELRRADGFIASLLDTRGQGTRLRTPALIFVLSVCMSLGLSFGLNWLGKQDLSEVSARVTMVAGFVGAVTTWLRRQTQWLRERREESDKTLRAVELAIENERQRQLEPLEAATQAARDEVTTIEKQQVAHQKSLARAQKAVRTLKKEISELSNARLLDKFIENRTGSDDYRKHLGLVALIRRDFEELSRLMEAVNRDEQADPNVPAINRIVLYIDDLDRCSEDTVVKVLQAVHLLLAFPLFVVVVGVDSRWVARCLNHTFKDLLKQGDTSALPLDPMTPGATAYDYLEKIFQIPIWLRPVSSLHRTSMVRGLLGRPSSEEHSQGAKVLELKPGPVTDTRGTGTQDDSAQRPTKNAQAEDAAPQAASGHGKPKTSASSDNTRGTSNEQELNPPSLVISKAELDFIDCLGPLLSPTPRVLKRFANTYRLIKACVPSDGQAEFMGEEHEGTSPSQVCLLLLTLVTSKPGLATKFLDQLAESGSDKAVHTLADLLLSSDKLNKELLELSAWLAIGPPAFQNTPLSLVRKLVPWVTRFSFR